MPSRHESAVRRHLVWVFIQGFLLTPFVIAALWDSGPWVPGLVLSVALACWLGYALAVNLLRLFQARASEANLRTVLAQAAVAGIFALGAAIHLYAANDDLLAINEAEHMPSAFVFGTLALVLIALAIRDSTRIAARSQQTVA